MAFNRRHQASDDLLVFLVGDGVIVPAAGLTAPRRDRLGRFTRF